MIVDIDCLSSSKPSGTQKISFFISIFRVLLLVCTSYDGNRFCEN